VSKPCSVLIAAPEVLKGMKERASAGVKGELLAFTDADALIALEAITKRRPKIVVLEKQFAATPRGTALINRIKADPALGESEIRVMAHDSDAVRVLPRTPASGAPAGDSGGPSSAAGAATATIPAPALDQRGTRRAPRIKIAGSVDVLVDGNIATLVDLSTIGAQVVSPTILKPNQRVRMALSDDVSNVRFNAAVAWASFEIPPKSGPRYRAGLEFVDADSGSVNAFCQRHKQH
jgi:PilZ domain-containing protein